MPLPLFFVLSLIFLLVFEVMFHWPSLCDYPYVASRSEHQLFVMVSDESPQVSIDIHTYILRFLYYCDYY